MRPVADAVPFVEDQSSGTIEVEDYVRPFLVEVYTTVELVAVAWVAEVARPAAPRLAVAGRLISRFFGIWLRARLFAFCRRITGSATSTGRVTRCLFFRWRVDGCVAARGRGTWSLAF